MTKTQATLFDNIRAAWRLVEDPGMRYAPPACGAGLLVQAIRHNPIRAAEAMSQAIRKGRATSSEISLRIGAE